MGRELYFDGWWDGDAEFWCDCCGKTVKPDEHPDGILCKPCPVCGYKYGTSWLMEEVPEDVIDWLFALPDTTVKPAWV